MSIYSIRLFGVFNSYKVKIASTFNIFIFYLARWYQVVGVSYLLYIVRFVLLITPLSFGFVHFLAAFYLNIVLV